MKANFVLALSATGMFAMTGAALAQDVQTAPAQDGGAPQTAQSDQWNTNSTSYGGATATSKSGSAMHTTPMPTSMACTPGLSCNIYQGQ